MLHGLLPTRHSKTKFSHRNSSHGGARVTMIIREGEQGGTLNSLMKSFFFCFSMFPTFFDQESPDVAVFFFLSICSNFEFHHLQKYLMQLMHI